MLQFTRFATSCLIVLALVVLLCGGVALGASPIEYEKEDHPPKLEGVLARIQKNWVTQERALAKATARQYGAAEIVGENITVVLVPHHGRFSESIDFAALSDIGVSIVAQSRHLLKVSAPIVALESLTHVEGVQFVRLPIRPNIHSVVSEGVQHITATAYSREGFAGRGAKVGVIDIGFVGVPSLQNEGELPGLSYRDFTEAGIFEQGSLDESAKVHGSACAEIVHDIAPDADIYLYKISDMVELGIAKDAAIHDGLDIVTVSLGWDFARGFGDGRGIACEIVDDAFGNNVLWVNAAGNEAQSKIISELSDPDSDGLHNFDVDDQIVKLKNRQTGDLYLSAGEKVTAVLTWNEWPLTSNDYDLLLVRIGTDGRPEVVTQSDTKQLQSAPFEGLEYEISESANYGLAIWKAPEARVTLFKLLSTTHDLEGPVSIAGSLSIPGDARGALTVGAMHHRKWATGPIAPYSSRGPTVDGRIKPDLVAPAGVLTISYGDSGYHGTSAATPHVAGAAALLKSSDPIHYNAQNLYDALVRSTVDMGDPGPDNVYGHGRLDLSLVPPIGRPIMELSRNVLDFGAVLLGQSETRSLGIVNPGRASLVITNIQLPSGQFRVSEPTITVAPGRSDRIAVTFSPQSEGDQSGSMTILGNLPRTSVTLQARGVRQPVDPAPRIAVDASRRDFGGVDVGGSKSLTVTVTNTGDAALSVTDIVASDQRVSASPRQLSIPPKQNGYITLRFEPNQSGDLSARVTIYSNDSKSPAVSFPVTGRGRQPETRSFALSLVADATENQGVYAVPEDGVIAVEIHGRQVKDAIGFRALFDFDAASFAYADFDIGDDIPNGHSPGPYFPPDPSSVEVMAASFGGRIAEPSAKLGTVRFAVADTFKTGQMRLQFARIRRSGKFEGFADPVVLKFTKQGGRTADFDGDGAVGFSDFLQLAGAFGLSRGDAGYDERYDLDGNGMIGFSDFLIFAGSFGT